MKRQEVSSIRPHVRDWFPAAESTYMETRVHRHSLTARLLGIVLKTTAGAIAAFKAWRRTGPRWQAIADLPPDRVRDIGHAEAPAPVLEVKAGLITNLMSMR
jgi:hypothetical protein